MIIKKGTHSNFRVPTFFHGIHKLSYDVTFTQSCVYDISDEQRDINKLFGVGYFPYHHCDSVRFGWRYVLDMGIIEILSYSYINSKRIYETLCFVNIDETIKCELIVNESNHVLQIDNKANTHVIDLKPKKIAYLLHPYFGGNMTAPHDMEIKMIKNK